MDTIALILSIIGSLNWGLVGIFKFDLIAWIFGGQTADVSRIRSTLVALAGLWSLRYQALKGHCAPGAAHKPKAPLKGELSRRSRD